jgi:subtilisin family serine protease
MPFTYLANGREVTLYEDPRRIGIYYREAMGLPRLAAGKMDVTGANPADALDIPSESLRIVTVPDDTGQGPAAISRLRESMAKDPNVQRVARVFTIGERTVVPSTRVNLGFRVANRGAAEALFKKFSGRIVSEVEGAGEYTVALPPGMDPLAVVEELTGNPDLNYVEPDFITIGTHVPRDWPNPGVSVISTPLPGVAAGPPMAVGRQRPTKGQPALTWGRQYALEITEAAGAHRVVTERDCGLVTVAVLDEGVDLVHPELKPAITASFDAFQSAAIGPQPQRWDGHGTACAGLVGARGVPGVGVIGVARGCQLLAVRIAYSAAPTDHSPWITTESGIRDGIDWAWRTGADILSNSWGGGAPSTAIALAFRRARTLGRQGRGCVIVIAAGNDSGPVDFPGNLPDVVAVSASNEYDEAKTKRSQDGEYWWGSNYGPEVSVAAPGVHNLTTDISGPDGYDAGDYFATFNGTSSAAPIVAGVAALILARYPAWTEAQVRDRLTTSVDQVGKDSYVGGRNNHMGFGRVNALKAVR